jgi:phosphotransferase system enzyme I (PtsI)
VSSSQIDRRGIAASRGIVIGPAYVLRRARLVIPEYRITEDQVEPEVGRLQRAVRETQRRLDEIRRGMRDAGLLADIFDAQFLFLRDPTLIDNALQNIREGQLNAEWALQREFRRLEAMFESMSDPYIRERASDVSFVVRRVLQELMGREPQGLKNVPPGVVVIAVDISPAELAQAQRGRVAGFVTEAGSKTSHVTIIARSIEISAVVGVGSGLVRNVVDGTQVIVDGNAGRVLIDPDQETIERYKERRAQLESFEKQLLRYVKLPAETRDGVHIRLLANVDQLEEVPDTLRYGAEGIGLYRTEFLFMNRTEVPDEDEQLESYRTVLEGIAPRSAVIRTLDLGADKRPFGIDRSDEPNPALGLRGVRMSIAQPDVFRTQLRALLRASVYGELKILLPMLSSLSELQFAARELQAVREELEARGVPVAERVELGVMVETPAAAIIADMIAPHCDFLSIGTNDLLQYSLAVDRTNEHLSYLYEPLHPANLRLIQQVCQAGRRAGIAVAMCGEMAGDPLYSWILMALGLAELSMAPSSIPLLKKILRESTAVEGRELLAEVVGLSHAADIRKKVGEKMAQRFPLEFEEMTSSG